MPFAIILIPVYNHKKKIGAVLDGCLNYFAPKDILVVDDGSTDGSALEAEKRGVNIITHTKNTGKGSALISGFAWGIKHDAQWILTMDADGQHNPDEIPFFLQEAKKDSYDMLIGNRDFSIKSMPLKRSLSNRITSKILSILLKQEISDSQNGFRMIKTDVIKKIDVESSDFILETEMIINASVAGFNIGFVPISTIYSGEKSHMSNFSTTIRFIKTIWFNRKVYSALPKKV